jgi:hypothetical protein
MMADRRLSCKGRAPKDDARKMMFLDTTDGMAILGYAGLGATALGTEPADWMSAVLRGRNLPLELSLGVLADAMKAQFPRHMVQIPRDYNAAHNLFATAFLGDEVRLYTIDLVFASDRKSYQFRYTRHVAERLALAKARTPRVGIGGSGALYLVRNKKWMRSLLSLIRTYDRGRVSSQAVADQLANLNEQVHLGVTDKSVGPRCIVGWRHRKGGIHIGGGGHQFYTGTTRDACSPALPTITNGMDVRALLEAMWPRIRQKLDSLGTGQHSRDWNTQEINAELARVPDRPDEYLR